MMTLSRTLMPLKMVVSWNVRTTPLRATICGASPEMRSPRNRTSPELGRRNEAISLNSVDLPAPFGPMTERISLLSDVERDVVDRDQAAEALGQGGDFASSFAHAAAASFMNRRRTRQS